MSNKTSYYLKVNGNVEQVEYTYQPGVTTDWDLIPSDQFLSPEEIASHQFASLSPDDVTFFRITPIDDMIMLHHTYGQWIRNNYGLWHPNNPHVIPGDIDEGHPDGLSMLAINGIHKRCNANDAAYKNAMSIV